MIRATLSFAFVSFAFVALEYGCGGDVVVTSDDADASSVAEGGGGDATLDDGAGGDASGRDATSDATSDGATSGDAGDGAPITDGASTDSDSGEGADTGDGNDGAPEGGGPPCSPPQSACATQDGGAPSGLCKGGVCVPCTDPSDDTACSAAYDDGSSTGYICKAGACVPGTCHTSADCDGGLCGVTQANSCGPCATDSQCQKDPSYPNDICNVGTGQCVSAACEPSRSFCTANPADICCLGACLAGNCCDDSDCPALTPACDKAFSWDLAGKCDACVLQPASPTRVYVDPINGVDAPGKGSGTALSGLHGRCAVKTVTYALAELGSNPAPGSEILIIGGPVSEASGETFPIVIPSNVLLDTANNGAPYSSIEVPPGEDGIVLAGDGIVIENLLIDGQGNTAARGIVVTGGSTKTNQMGSITVQDFAGPAIEVSGSGAADIWFGTTLTGNGSAGSAAGGLVVRDNGYANVGASSGELIAISDNTGAGIVVQDDASLLMTGLPSTGGSSSIEVNGNTGDGILFAPATSTAGAPVPQSSITGIVVSQSGGNGLVIQGGANVKVRKSYVLGNGGSGIDVVTNPGGCHGQAGCNDSDISAIDLGQETGPDWGLNTLQDGKMPNDDVGICLSLDAPAPGSLHAAGNIFSSSVNCSTSTATLGKNQCQAGSKQAVGVATTPNTIDTATCTN